MMIELLVSSLALIAMLSVVVLFTGHTPAQQQQPATRLQPVRTTAGRRGREV